MAVAGVPILSDPIGEEPGGRSEGPSTTRTELPRHASEAEKQQARELEQRLTRWDRQVNAVPDNERIPVVDENGKPTGDTVSGADYKWAWNHTGTRLVHDGTNFNNGGAGGGTGGSFDHNGVLIKGVSQFTMHVIADYRQRSVDAGRTADEGEDTLIFHEVSHNFALGHTYSVTTPPHPGNFTNADWARERHVSDIGHAILDTIGGHYVCAVTSCD